MPWPRASIRQGEVPPNRHPLAERESRACQGAGALPLMACPTCLEILTLWGHNGKWSGMPSHRSRRFGAFGLGSFIMAVTAQPARPETLYRARQETIGCTDREVVEQLSNRADPNYWNPQWRNRMMQQGRCAVITPRSDWSLVTLDGSSALMAYRGQNMPPASFYIERADLADSSGHSPGYEPPQPPPSEAPIPDGSQSTPAAAAAVSQSQDTATPPAPSDLPPPNLESSQTSAANSASGDQAQDMPPAASDASRGDAASSDEGSSFGGIIGLALVGIAGIVGLKAWRAKKGRNEALATAAAEIDRNAANLRVRRLQTVQPDHYGTVFLDKWEKEKHYFIQTRILPLLGERGLGEAYTQVAVQFDIMIEEAAQRAIPPAIEGQAARFISSPETFDPRMDPIHYEAHCALLLQKAGWETRLTTATGDQGADVIAKRDGKVLVLQCKLYSSPVGNDAVQQVIGARGFQAADLAAVVSNQPFTRSAQQLAGVNHVHLLHHEQLVAFTG